MSQLINRSGRTSITLGAAVANSATVDLAYPSGTSQKSFTAGLKGTGSYVMLNDNDKYLESDSKISMSFGASLITLTNSTGATWPIGTKVELNVDQQDGNDVIMLQIPVFLAAITGAGDVVTDIRPGVYGKIEYWEYVVTQPVTTGSKLATLNLEIDTTNVTGGTIALTSAAATPLGKAIAMGSDITANNTLTPESTLSVEAASVTAFAEGSGFLNIRIRKTKSADGVI
ncbi:MAG: hypothetical protein PS018_11460 [bacterium]|nr:hypothetical protein [bacterium]